jgi:hypothetical protein
MLLTVLATALVAGAGLFLIGLGLLAWIRPGAAGRFLLGFAATAPRHALELGVRLAVGAAFVVAAPRTAAPALCAVAGWVLLATTAALLAVPWRVHRDFARRTVPAALRHLRLLGLAALAAGGRSWPACTPARRGERCRA